MTGSPFLLNGTIRHHLSKYLSCDQQFVERFLEDLYVDDVTSGTKTIEQGKEFYEIQENSETKILNEEQFGLTKNNYKKVLERDIQNDKMIFQFESFICFAKTLIPTKRNVLKVCASFYDPLGFVSPITARIKTIFQLLCKKQCSWDENISSNIESFWNDFLTDLKQTKILRVKRFAFVQLKEIT